MGFRKTAALAATAALCLSLLACSREAAPKTKKFTVVDRGSGRTVASYSYAEGSVRPNEIHVYGADRKPKESHSLEYDEQGRLAYDSVTSFAASGATVASSITYSYHEEAGEDGKISKSVQTASTGETIETFYGYDEAGQARGVVQKSGGSLLMKDYPQ